MGQGVVRDVAQCGTECGTESAEHGTERGTECSAGQNAVRENLRL